MDLSELKYIMIIQKLMNTYQKENNIKGMCMANTSFLYRIICDNYHDLKIRTKVSPVICYYSEEIENKGNKEINIYFHTHLVIKIDEKKLIDSSYEVDSIKDNLYLDNIIAFQKCLINLKKTFGIEFDNERKKETIKQYLKFLKIANDINKNDKLITANQEYSDNLENYVIKKFNEKYGIILFL